jgi:hypothetical protein
MNKPMDPLRRSRPLEGSDDLTEAEFETVQLLRTGLEELDGFVPVMEPKLQWLEAQIEEHQSLMRRRFIRDMTVFIGVALLIIFVLISTLFRLPALFIALQAAALLAPPIFLLTLKRKRVKEQ